MLNAAWIVAVAMTLQTAPVPTPPAPTPTEWTDDRPVTRVVPNLVHDLTRLPTWETALTLGTGLFAVGMTHGTDASLANWVTESGDSTIADLGDTLGSAWFQVSGAAGTYLVGRMKHAPVVTHVGSDLIRAQLLNGVLTTGTKLAIGRTRPNGGSHSFPSGHTSATFASAVVLADHFGWRVGVPAYAVAGFVGWTRIRDNQHWLSDVVFGSAVGIIAGRTVTSSHPHSGWTIAPVMSRGGAAVYFLKQ